MGLFIEIRRRRMAGPLNEIDQTLEGERNDVKAVNDAGVERIKHPWTYFERYFEQGEERPATGEGITNALFFRQQLDALAKRGNALGIVTPLSKDASLVDATAEGEVDNYRTIATVSAAGDVNVTVTPTNPGGEGESLIYEYTRKKIGDRTLYTMSVLGIANIEGRKKTVSYLYGLNVGADGSVSLLQSGKEKVTPVTGSVPANLNSGTFFQEARPAFGRSARRPAGRH